jgi:hypothetical protein
VWAKTPVKIALAPGVTQPLPAPATQAVRVADTADERTVSDPTVIFHHENAYGKTSGGYVADRPIKVIFKEALEMALRTNSFTVSPDPNSPYELQSRIQDLTHDSIQTAPFSAKLVMKLTVRLELVEVSSRNAVWRDTLVGKSEDKMGWSGTGYVEKNFKAAAEDILRQLIADRTFRRFFEAK